MTLKRLKSFLKKHVSGENRHSRMSCPSCGGVGCRKCSNGIVMPLRSDNH